MTREEAIEDALSQIVARLQVNGEMAKGLVGAWSFQMKPEQRTLLEPILEELWHEAFQAGQISSI